MNLDIFPASTVSVILNIILVTSLVILYLKYRKLARGAEYLRGKFLRLKHLTPGVRYTVKHHFRPTICRESDDSTFYLVLSGPNWKTARVVVVEAIELVSNHPLVHGDMVEVRMVGIQTKLHLVELCKPVFK